MYFLLQLNNRLYYTCIHSYTLMCLPVNGLQRRFDSKNEYFTTLKATCNSVLEKLANQQKLSLSNKKNVDNP